MSAKDCRWELYEVLVAMFAGRPDIPIAEANIKRYATAPSETATSPNFCIIYTVRTTAVPLVVAESADNSVILGVKLATRLANTEASREAAEDWLDDAEEAVLEAVVTAVAETWQYAEIVNVRRDADRATWGQMRTTDILVQLNQ